MSLEALCAVFGSEPSEPLERALSRAKVLASCDPVVALAAILAGQIDSSRYSWGAIKEPPVPEEKGLEPEDVHEPVAEPEDAPIMVAPDVSPPEPVVEAPVAPEAVVEPDVEPPSRPIETLNVTPHLASLLLGAGLETDADILAHEDLTQIKGIGVELRDDALVAAQEG